LKGIDNRLSILAGGRDVPTNLTEVVSAIFGSEGARDFLFDFDHAYISLALVIVKRHAKVVHKGQHLRLVVLEAVKQILGWRLFDPAPFFWLLRRLGWWWIGLEPFSNEIIILLLKFGYFLGFKIVLVETGLGYFRFDVEEQDCHL
jgi:hypothetical protein